MSGPLSNRKMDYAEKIQMLEGIANLHPSKSILERQYEARNGSKVEFTLGAIMDEFRDAVILYYRANKSMRPVMNYKTGNCEFQSGVERFAWHLARDFTDFSQLEKQAFDDLSSRVQSIFDDQITTDQRGTITVNLRGGESAEMSVVMCSSVILINFIEWMDALFTQERLKYENMANGISEMVVEAMNAFRVPGTAVGIIVDGEVMPTKGYGLRNLNEELPVTEDTVFAIASCTKAFTTHLLGQLVDEGKITWDDPVVRHLPEFRLKDERVTLRVTIRDIITHRSGLPRHGMLLYGTGLERKDILSKLQHLDLNADLREKFQYNNLMYTVVAGLIAEKATGQSREEAVNSRILNPPGMQRTSVSANEVQQCDDYSLPFREVDGVIRNIPFRNIDNEGPAGSINSSVANMVKWLRLRLSDGTSISQKRCFKNYAQPSGSIQELS